ncbi:hypothetical protein SAMN04489735_10626 [Aneurinibacillus thermoaerophilus]|uniref:Uncharacterized protein n=1 Tax=Aneurinibacillus thermoaerophilus TaxID=143495 RepID=A0A1G8FCE7_ANETH|nr:hypothetical protein [Aneurinibacillus thermoaerophilus]QYY44788.1 hypothetical protein K3F53_18815 [Aneurinibacillus thermoaerophilus]SDH79775.1 hypothetical protein SAMN04489735_10626 [Aneurinibacillus thermoaerophilus]
MRNPSIAEITSSKPEAEKVIPTLKPSEQELGWLPFLIDVEDVHVGQECFVIPAEGTYGQSLVIPIGIRLPRTATITNHAPIEVLIKGKSMQCQTTVPITINDVGKTALLVPVVNEKEGPLKYVITGVIQ